MSLSASTRHVEKVKGSHLFKIMGYQLEKDIEKGKFLESVTFNVGGYDWSIGFYPNGDAEAEFDQASIFLLFKSKGHSVKAQPSFMILNENGNPISERTPRVHTFSKENEGYGFSSFMKKSTLESFAKEDCLAIQCTVSVFKAFPVEHVFPVVVPPPDIQQLTHLLEAGYGADATFEVKGQTFNAHMCILAMRSKVFRAQFFGPLKEKSGTVIKIEDMEAQVFKSLLYFIYSETVPEFEDINECEKKHNMAQHLLVAADRYDLERLKIMCENILYGSINKSNVVSLLLLAERHNCIHLKAACLKLLASSEILGEVVATGQFQYFVERSVLNTVSEVEPIKLPVQQLNWLHYLFNQWWERREVGGKSGGQQHDG